MSKAGDAFLIPHYIKAESSDGLRRFMLKNNLENNKEYQYYQIVYDGKHWYAWYYEVAKESRLIAKR